MGVTAEHDGGDDRNMLVKELTDYDVKTYGAEVEEWEEVKIISRNGWKDFMD